jgi:hypothetical protein
MKKDKGALRESDRETLRVLNDLTKVIESVEADKDGKHAALLETIKTQAEITRSKIDARLKRYKGD